MKLCRFNGDRLGLVEGEDVHDVTEALASLPVGTWPGQPGDPLILHLAEVMLEARRLAPQAASRKLHEVSLGSPIVSPSKIMAAPANYRLHVLNDGKDPGAVFDVHMKQIEGVEAPAEKLGLFLKANSSLAGPGDGLSVGRADRRHDHEIELVVVIGRKARAVSQSNALDYVAGYCIGLDMTVRGVEDRSWRKSLDGYTMLGPWLVTADEISDPHALQLSLSVNGVIRQQSSTAAMTVRIQRLIEMAAANYTLYPGDVIMTGTPDGVGPVVGGDVINASCSGIGGMTVAVRAGS